MLRGRLEIISQKGKLVWEGNKAFPNSDLFMATICFPGAYLLMMKNSFVICQRSKQIGNQAFPKPTHYSGKDNNLEECAPQGYNH